MSRNRMAMLALIAFAALAFPVVADAQEPAEEEDPTVVRLSFFMCDLGEGVGEQINENLETRVIPIWNDLVQQGRVEDYGYLYHWWADEWNVVIYTIAESIPAIIEAEEEAGNRLEEQYGEDFGPFAGACPHHRDGFYTLGPSTGMGPAEDAPGGN
ncbi:MAG TPA: hypothetical protein VM737_03840 [Gemmatimonadota bacterium]|nr:hypothetical protein [Gemmatimonadota bacterium]